MGGYMYGFGLIKKFYSTAFQGQLQFQETGKVGGKGMDGEGRAGGMVRMEGVAGVAGS